VTRDTLELFVSRNRLEIPWQAERFTVDSESADSDPA